MGERSAAERSTLDESDYHLECPDNCSLKEGTKWGHDVTERLLAGVSHRTIISEIKELSGGKVTISLGTITRHKKHVVKGTPIEAPVSPQKTATNIEILESIIQKGFQNQKNWKPTISDTMKAMDMWFRLTQGNPFDELLDTLAAASIGAAEETDPAKDGETPVREMPEMDEEED